MTCYRLANIGILLKMVFVKGAGSHAYRSWWQLFSLWGADAALAALCWGLLIAAHHKITVLTIEPLLVLSSLVWLVVMIDRLRGAVSDDGVREAGYYRAHLAAMGVLVAAVAMTTIWMLLFRVGQYMLNFISVPLFFVLLGYVPLLRKVAGYRVLCASASFVFCCAAPAYYYSFFQVPLRMLLSAPLWLLVGIVHLFLLERDPSGGAVSGVFRSICLLLLFLFCVRQVAVAPQYMRGMYITLCTAAACLHVYSALRKRLTASDWYAIGWTFMALPALLGLFAIVPGTW